MIIIRGSTPFGYFFTFVPLSLRHTDMLVTLLKVRS